MLRLFKSVFTTVWTASSESRLAMGNLLSLGDDKIILPTMLRLKERVVTILMHVAT